MVQIDVVLMEFIFLHFLLLGVLLCEEVFKNTILLILLHALLIHDRLIRLLLFFVHKHEEFIQLLLNRWSLLRQAHNIDFWDRLDNLDRFLLYAGQ